MPYSSPKKLTTFEKYLLKREKIRKSLQKYTRDNKKKISFLFIPHDENHIFKLELSFFMLYFLGFLAILLTILSLYFFSHSWLEKRSPEIYALNRRNTAIFLLYELMNNDLEENASRLKQQTEELNQFAWGKKPDKLLMSSDYLPEIDPNQSYNQEDSPASDIFSGIVTTSSGIIHDLKKIMPEFQNAADYLLARESIFSSLPKGRPLKPGVGFVTSTFGNRIDPFGLTSVGEFHSGVDFASGEGTPIYATAPGVVGKLAASVGGLGNAVRINHINGIFTLYGHCSAVLVKEGDIVKKGDLIGLVGSTGKATGAHVHYEVRIGFDPPTDPVEFINLE